MWGLGLGFGVLDLGSRALGFWGPRSSSGKGEKGGGTLGFGFKVKGLWFGVQGLGLGTRGVWKAF